MHIDTLIAEVKNSLKQYDVSGQIDDLSIYDWVFSAMRRFGNLITTKHQAAVSVRDGRGVLPDNFESLRYATLCDKGWAETNCPKDTLQKSYFWKERIEKTGAWETCGEGCNNDFKEKTIVEKVFFHENPVNFHYKNPRYLKLSRHTNKNYYARGCANLKINSPREITINQKTLYTNFPEGEVIIEYYGFEVDEEGRPYIPETPQARLETFLSYHIKRKIFEELWLNSDDENIQGKIQYLLSQEQQEFSLALTDVKAATLTMKGFYNLEKMNQKRTAVFEY